MLAGVGVAAAARSVSPVVVVTHDAFHAHVEPDVAVNPRDPNNLLGASQFVAHRLPLPGAFASSDGGRHWHDDGVLPLPHGFELGADTTVAFDDRGNGFISALMWHGGGGYASRVIRGGIFLWRTTNGGRSFSRPQPIYVGAGFQDHPWLGVRSNRRRTELFVAWTNRAGLELTRSLDDGRTFSPPHTIVAGNSPTNPVLVVGTGHAVEIFFQSFAGSSIRVYSVASRDDGMHFARERQIAAVAGIRRGGGPKGGTAPPPLLGAALDPASGTTAVAIASFDAHVGHPVIDIWEKRSGDGWREPIHPGHGALANMTELQPRLAFARGQLYVSFFAVSRHGQVSEVLAHAKIDTARFHVHPLSNRPFRFNGFLGDYQALAVHGHTVHALWNAANTGRLEIEARSFDAS